MRKKLLFALSASIALTLFLPVISQANEWRQDAEGWRYEIGDGEDSYAKNGWQLINEKWYYFDASGYMKTGWIHVDDDWYYLNADGSLLTDAYTPDGYWVNQDGKLDDD